MKTKPDPRSGLDDSGRWTPAFEGQRPPFEQGNRLNVGNAHNLRHGAYALVRLGPRAAEIADTLRDGMPSYSPSDESAVQALAIVLARIEAAEQALAEVDATASRPLASFVGEPGARLERLRADLRSWLSVARRYQHDLGLSPRARWELGLVAASAVGAAHRAKELDPSTLPEAERQVLREAERILEREGAL